MDIDSVDPRLRQAMRRASLGDPSRRAVRTLARVATRLMPVPRVEGVSVSTARLGGTRVRVYRPAERSGDAALFWVHGGGLLFGDARQDEALCAGTARELGIPVVSANYRFAPEHPFPAAHHDLLAAWHGLQQAAPAEGIDPERIAVGGESAGGGLAAALAQRLLDDGGVQPVAQWLFAPMIDDRTATDETLDALDHWVWNNAANRVGWSGYLGASYGALEVAPYAVAARRADLSGLPPVYVAVGDIELFLAEDREYARRLAEAGVPVTVDLVPGAPHGFENWARDAEPARQLLARARAWLRVALQERAGG